ncbi:hypothetical protein TGS27_1825 [Geobacillus stearothermophilus]|uniref:Uncharacterized protein n=3 Tax=Geobacillus stearothermophilus TaxID=1422 RepID=A0A150MLZ3_GEOSE|nr:hypothetical protein [Geobacillus stearothermophilus]KAF6512596.1 hypothetical protein GS8_75 [Geobacillus stearothermophilus]KYD25513.1 hypothetical protein B4109_2893 [Geobacillus stearothermophilus]OAO80775.1 hypothetical protein TGS27_1825 [Geobacillus stearothermophilus]
MMERWKQWAKRIKKEIFVLYSACRDRRVPVWLRQGIGAFPIGETGFAMVASI